MSQPIDGLERARALDPEQSFICVAPAGSGKTELLTQRVLVLLARVRRPEEILAITFTRKAAAEMHHRVINALQMAKESEPQESHKRHTWQLARAALRVDDENNWQLLNNPHRLQIRTFDGLCASLVKALPLQAQISSGVTLSDDPERLFTLAANSLLNELESGQPVADELALLLGHLDNNQNLLRALFVSLLNTRAAWLPVMLGHVGDVRCALEACLSQLRFDHVQRLLKMVPEELQGKLCALADFAAKHLPEDSSSPIVQCANLKVLPDASSLDVWRGLQNLLQSSAGTWRKRLTKNEGFPTTADGLSAPELKAIKTDLTGLITTFSAIDDFEELLADVSKLPYETYPEQQWKILRALTSLLPRLVAHLQWIFASEGELDFTEMSLRAEQALGSDDEPTDLALRLDYSIQHILVDEFQDTSSQQMQLIQRLTAGWQVPDGRTLFCVGDAMQSIYAFRSANVGLFLRCLQGFLGDIPLDVIKLNTNFRSQAGVVEWINHAFYQAFPKTADLNLGAVNFNQAVPFKQASVEAIKAQAFSSEDAREIWQAEGVWVVQQIEHRLAEDSNASFAILGRGRKELSRILPALKRAGLKYRAVDLDPLSSVSAVQDVWALTRALLDTQDVVAWMSILRAPWCGLTLDELTLLRAKKGNVLEQSNAFLQDVTGHEGLSRMYAVMSRAVQDRERNSLVDWVKGTWLALGGAATITLEDQLNVERFFEGLSELSTTQLQAQPEKLTRLLETLYALPDPNADGQIQIMTMHKSKGLEFDSVFLVGLGNGGAVNDSPLMRWHEQIFAGDEKNTWLISPVGERGQEKDQLYQWLGLQQARREKFEACSLLYVAATRAKERLYLSAELPLDKKTKAPGSPKKGSLLNFIWPVIRDAMTVRCQQIPVAEHPDLYEEVDQTLKRLPSSWQLPDSCNVIQPNSTRGLVNGNLASSKSVVADDGQIARAVGTVVHRMLELAITKPDFCLPPVSEIRWQQSLLLAGVPKENVEQACRLGKQYLKTGLSSASPLMIHLKNATEVHPEFALDVIGDDGVLSNCRIDLWWRDASDQVYLLDYKTAQPKETHLDHFELQQRDEHFATLEKYRSALSHYLQEPVKCVLYLLATDSWLELSE